MMFLKRFSKRKAFVPPAGAPEFSGVPVRFGKLELVMPPLNFAALKPLLPRIEAHGSLSLSSTTIALVTDCAHAALLRNYPSVSRADCERWIDVANFYEVFQACMGVSGLEEKPGEIAPGQSAGTRSTSS